MSDSLHRLAVHESESRRKDDVIASLRMELAAYKKNSRSKDIRSVIAICKLTSVTLTCERSASQLCNIVADECPRPKRTFDSAVNRPECTCS